MKKTILIVTKHPESKGGVVNYYNHLFKVFKSDEFHLKWFTLGSRPEYYDKRLNRKYAYLFEFITDIYRFIHIIIKDKSICIVQVSPSFFELPIIRDFVYLSLARFFRKKTVTFFRGWSTRFENKMFTNPGIYGNLLRYYAKSDAILILAEKFKKVLLHYGFNEKKIHVTRTMFVKTNIVSKAVSKSNRLKFLYVARLSFQKGIMNILEAVSLLNQKDILVNVEVYGHYANKEIEEKVHKFLAEHKLGDQIKICSFISGADKYKKFAEADVFLLPTYHDEGCPNSIIEALATGLFVVSTAIGAIDELVKNEINGLIIPPNNSRALSKAMLWGINNIEQVRKIGKENSIYAYKNFEKDILVNQIKNIYRSITK